MDTLKLNGWLNQTLNENDSGNYSHRLLKENLEHRESILSDWKQTVQKAHEDTKRHLRELAGYSLDPFDSPEDTVKGFSTAEHGVVNALRDPTKGYPERLELKTLKGFFGEIFAGVVAESFPHFHLEGWKVPIYPFRFHRSAYHQLEKWRQTDEKPRTIPGRVGDDMLAFYRNDEGKITHSLVCEAKCSNGHDKRTVEKAHQQASGKELRPVDILALIDILRDYDDPTSQSWKKALQVLFNRDIKSDYERCDLISHIFGKMPSRTSTWIHYDEPNLNYTAGRRLECVEIHINDVDGLVKGVYDVDGE